MSTQSCPHKFSPPFEAAERDDHGVVHTSLPTQVCSAIVRQQRYCFYLTVFSFLLFPSTGYFAVCIQTSTCIHSIKCLFISCPDKTYRHLMVRLLTSLLALLVGLQLLLFVRPTSLLYGLLPVSSFGTEQITPNFLSP